MKTKKVIKNHSYKEETLAPRKRKRGEEEEESEKAVEKDDQDSYDGEKE